MIIWFALFIAVAQPGQFRLIYVNFRKFRVFNMHHFIIKKKFVLSWPNHTIPDVVEHSHQRWKRQQKLFFHTLLIATTRWIWMLFIYMCPISCFFQDSCEFVCSFFFCLACIRLPWISANSVDPIVSLILFFFFFFFFFRTEH